MGTIDTSLTSKLRPLNELETTIQETSRWTLKGVFHAQGIPHKRLAGATISSFNEEYTWRRGGST